MLDAAEGAGSGKVWLTFVGGGAFGNRPAWIGAAIRRAITAVEGYALDLRIGHYRRVDAELRGWVDGG